MQLKSSIAFKFLQCVWSKRFTRADYNVQDKFWMVFLNWYDVGPLYILQVLEVKNDQLRLQN